jgi:hypothetical protein
MFSRPNPLLIGSGTALVIFRFLDLLPNHSQRLCMADWHSSGDWQFKQSVAMTLPTVILKVGWLRCWAARFLFGRVAG